MYKINVKLSNNKEYEISIGRPELIYGATAIMLNDIVERDIFAINPVTEEKMDIIKGNENRFIIPMHNKKDYLLAKQRNIKLKLAVMPYFKGERESEIRNDVETLYRHSVIAIIKDPKTNKYLCEDAQGGKCKSFVLGGIEEGEKVEEAALREIKEETGYTDVKITKISNYHLINHFYADYKGVNRFAKLEIVFGELNSSSHIEISEEEKKKHTIKWLDIQELDEFININHNRFALHILKYGESAFEEDGIMNTNDEFNNMSSSGVQKIIIEKYCIK